jgi:hypothetical protein
MLPNEVFALACRAYYEEQGLIVDGRNGQFAHCPLPKKDGKTGYYLLWEHHQHQGLLQSRDLGKCCFFAGDAKKWLLTADYFPENFFELWDIYEEFVTGLHGMTREEHVAHCRKNGHKAHRLKIGIHGVTREEKVALGKKLHELGIGIHGMTKEERVAHGKKLHELGIGIFGMTDEQIVRRNKKRKGGRPRVRVRVTNSEGDVNTFETIREAAEILNCNKSCVRRRLAAGKPAMYGKLEGLYFERVES